jgi:adenylate cyclase
MPPSQRGRFRRKLAVLTSCLAILPALAMGWALLRIYRQSLEASYTDRLYTVVADLAHTAELEISGARQQLEVVAGFLSQQQEPVQQRITRAKVAVSMALAFSRVAVYDEAGQPIDTLIKSGDDPVPARLSAELMKDVRADGFAVAPSLQAEGGSWLPLILPVQGDGFRWYVCAPLPLDEVERRLVDLATTLEQHVAVAVVDRQMTTLAHSSRTVVPTEQAEALGLAASFAALRNHRVLMVKRYRAHDADYVAAVSGLSTLPLLFIAQIPNEVVLAPLARVRVLLLCAVLATALIAVLVGLWFARRLTAPVQELVGYAETLGRRQFSRPLHLHTGDELELLGDAMAEAARLLAASEAELKEQAAIRSDLGRYLPQHLVERVVGREQTIELGGVSREVTVMFADVAGFTALAKSQPPQVMATVLNELFTILTEIVFRYGGTIDKFIGDCVMALWNAPHDQADHARRALACAEDMVRWLEVGNEGWAARFGIRIELAIGINTGPALVGNFGSKTRMEYTCIGDAVNLAARLEHLARPQQVLITRATREAAGAEFDYHSLGVHALAGLDQPVEVIEVLA